MAKHKPKRHHDKKRTVVKEPVRTTMRNTIRSGRFRFAAVFVLSCIGLYGLVQVLPSSVLSPINEHVARMLGSLLNAFGIPASSAGDIVSEKVLAFRIIPECTPIFTGGLFLCFVVFYTATFREKATGLLMGIQALYLGNLARLAATFMISRHDRGFFDVVHVYLGQVFTILLVIVACIIWLKWLDRKELPQSIPMKAAGFLIRFSLISGCLFLFWLKVHHWYIWFLDRFTLFGFSLFNYRVPLARQTVYYYETFSIVVFTALVLAAWSLPWKMKVKGLAGGLGILFVTHLIHRINNVLLAYFKFIAMVPVDLTLLVIGQYLLPVLFLMVLFRLQRIDLREVST